MHGIAVVTTQSGNKRVKAQFTLRYHITPAGTAAFKKDNTGRCCYGYTEMRPYWPADGSVRRCGHFEAQMDSSSSDVLPYDLAVLLLRPSTWPPEA